MHREQEIKQLQGWAQTVQNLVNKFEDGLKELGPLAAIEEAEAGLASPDEEAPASGEEEVPTAVASARALTNRARDLTAHRQGIAKLRQHFSKVRQAAMAWRCMRCCELAPNHVRLPICKAAADQTQIILSWSHCMHRACVTG